MEIFVGLKQNKWTASNASRAGKFEKENLPRGADFVILVVSAGDCALAATLREETSDCMMLRRATLAITLALVTESATALHIPSCATRRSILGGLAVCVVPTVANAGIAEPGASAWSCCCRLFLCLDCHASVPDFTDATA
jgi:hypothetical protein